MKTDKDKSKIKVVELFAGVGGFRLALERTSNIFDTIWANQWEPGKSKQWAYDCYVKHFGESDNHVNENIENVIDSVPFHDLLVGGFPCQDYSVARTGASGIKGKKGVLWWSIIDIIIKIKPKLILLENVDRLVKSPTEQRGRDFGIMLRTLENAGYNVEWRIINAADYGFAQKRKRIFIFAFKKELTDYLYDTRNQCEIICSKGFFSSIFHVIQKDYKKQSLSNILNGFQDLVDVSLNYKNTFYNSGSMIDGQVVSFETEPVIKNHIPLEKILEKDKVGDRYFINEKSDKFERLKRKKNERRISPEGEIYFYSEGDMTFPDPLDKPARTILTSEGSVSRSTHVVKDSYSGKYRLLTPLECERINGFEDDWTNTGMPHSFRYFCMGNALVVPVVEEIAKNIIEIWRKING